MTVRPLLFLDLDDVLCIDEAFNSREMLKVFRKTIPDSAELWRHLVDAKAAANLRQLHVEFKPMYVISSTWATHLNRDQLVEALQRSRLDFVVESLHEHWQTQRALSSSRRDEIDGWLNEHHQAGQPFIILDDTYSGDTLAHSPLALDGHVVLCLVKRGFTAEKLDEARGKLRRQIPS